VPRCVDDRDVDRSVLEERPVVAAPEQAFTRRDRDRRVLANVPERLRVARVDLDPEDVERLDGARDLEESFRLEVEVEVQQDVDVRAGALAERRQLLTQGGEDVAIRVQLGERSLARETRRMQIR